MSAEDSFNMEYEAWLESLQKDLRNIFALLKTRLSDHPEKLIQDLKEAETYYARCAYILAQANSFLDKAGYIFLPPKDENQRELDRRVTLEYKISHIREMRDKVEAMVNSIKQRLILGESLLAYSRQFLERQRTIQEPR